MTQVVTMTLAPPAPHPRPIGRPEPREGYGRGHRSLSFSEHTLVVI